MLTNALGAAAIPLARGHALRLPPVALAIRTTRVSLVRPRSASVRGIAVAVAAGQPATHTILRVAFGPKVEKETNANWAALDCLDTHKQKVRVTGMWPVSHRDMLIPGLAFNATLTEQVHPKYGVSFEATAVMWSDPLSVLTCQHIKSHAPGLTQLDKLLDAFGERLYATFVEVADGKRPVADLGLGRRVSTKYLAAFVARRACIELCHAFPAIPVRAAVLLDDTTVDDVRANPYVLAGVTVRGVNMLHVADQVALQELQRRPEDPQRVEAHVRAAFDWLRDDYDSRCQGSTWFPAVEIALRALSQPQRVGRNAPPRWPIPREAVDALFPADGRPPVAFVRHDDGMWALSERVAEEEELAAHLASVRASTTISSQLRHGRRVLELLDEHLRSSGTGRVAADQAASTRVARVEAELAAFDSGWRAHRCDYEQLDSAQRGAVRMLLESRVVAIIGGAGVGKSLTVGFIARFLKALGIDIRLTAPTGLAATRLAAYAKMEARTMHSEAYREDQGDALAVDETSMAALATFNMLLKKHEQLGLLLLVGDEKQLPSIGAGAVLRDVIASGVVPAVTLDIIYRQSAGDGRDIALIAPEIASGTLPLCERAGGDLQISYIEPTQASHDASRERAIELCVEEQAQMLSNTNLDCAIANAAIQQRRNPPMPTKPEMQPDSRSKSPALCWRLHDRVMNLENRRDDDKSRGSSKFVANGECGIIASMDVEKETFEVLFDSGVRLEYPRNCAATLRHAYCVTAWKFQGSEAGRIVGFLGSSWQLSRELLYTLVTRARKKVTVFIPKAHLVAALGTSVREQRETRLAKSLVEKLAER